MNTTPEDPSNPSKIKKLPVKDEKIAEVLRIRHEIVDLEKEMEDKQLRMAREEERRGADSNLSGAEIFSLRSDIGQIRRKILEKESQLTFMESGKILPKVVEEPIIKSAPVKRDFSLIKNEPTGKVDKEKIRAELVKDVQMAQEALEFALEGRTMFKNNPDDYARNEEIISNFEKVLKEAQEKLDGLKEE